MAALAAEEYGDPAQAAALLPRAAQHLRFGDTPAGCYFGTRMSLDRSRHRDAVGSFITEIAAHPERRATWLEAGLDAAALPRFRESAGPWTIHLQEFAEWCAVGAELLAAHGEEEAADVISDVAVSATREGWPENLPQVLGLRGRVLERAARTAEAEAMWWEAFELGVSNDLVADRLSLCLFRARRDSDCIAVCSEMLARGLGGASGKKIRDRRARAEKRQRTGSGRLTRGETPSVTTITGDAVVVREIPLRATVNAAILRLDVPPVRGRHTQPRPAVAVDDRRRHRERSDAAFGASTARRTGRR